MLDNFFQIKKYQIGWNEYGTFNGKPVFYFHGTPGSRLEAQSANDIAKELGIHLIAPDRPGYGLSDPQDNFGLLDWPDIVSHLADKLNLNNFSILGFSGGGPYALACAHKIADRIKHITLAGSPGPFETDAMQNHLNINFKPLYELSATDYNLAIEQTAQLATSCENLLDVIQSAGSKADQAIFKQEKFRKYYLNNLTQAIYSGTRGVVNDLRNYTLPWKFKPEDIQHHVDIWHGDDDTNIGPAVAEYLTNKLKNNSTHILKNKGHYFLFEQWRQVLQNIEK